MQRGELKLWQIWSALTQSSLQGVINTEIGEQKLQFLYWLLASQYCVFLSWFLSWNMCKNALYVVIFYLQCGLYNSMWCDVIKNWVLTVSMGNKKKKKF